MRVQGKPAEEMAWRHADSMEGSLEGICVANGCRFEVPQRQGFSWWRLIYIWRYPKDSLAGGEYLAYPSGNGRGNIPGPCRLGCMRAETLVRAYKIKK